MKNQAAEERLGKGCVELLLRRASVRDFTDLEIEDGVLQLILEAACRTATGGNLQPYSILVIRDRKEREYLAERCGQSFMSKAPVHLLFCLDYHRLSRWAELMDAPFTMHQSLLTCWISFLDTAMASQQACTAADSLGLGSVYIGTITGFITELREHFKLPPKVLPVIHLCLGYPSKQPPVSARLPLGAVIHNEQYRLPSDTEIVQWYESKYQEKSWTPGGDNLEQLLKTAESIGGEALREKVRQRVARDGFINIAQYYWGIHYVASEMRSFNKELLRMLTEAGIDVCKDFD